MDAASLRLARKRLGWKQQQLAQRLGVSQGLVSLWEKGVRKFPAERLAQLQRLGVALDPLALPIQKHWWRFDYARELANLGYPGFAHLRRGAPRRNPAQLLVMALSQQALERRVAEALPWLALRYWQMDWEWGLREAKLRDLQNRLGFTLTLARELAEAANEPKPAAALATQEGRLRDSLLAKQDSYCNEAMTAAERKWLTSSRSPEAARWHVLSDLRTEHLVHA